MDPVSFRSSVEQGFCATYLFVWVAALYPMRNGFVYSIRFVDRHPFVEARNNGYMGFYFIFIPWYF